MELIMNLPELEKRAAEWRAAMEQTEHFSLDRTAPDKIPQLWDKLAPDYDSRLGQDVRRVEKTLEILRQIGALNSDTVAIDVGCGTGTFALELAMHCRRVYAFDLSSGMLDVLRKKTERMGITNVIPILGDWKTAQLSGFDPEISLALSCLNTGINDMQSLDKMNKISRAWCCYITVAGNTQAAARNELQEIVFGRALKTGRGNDIIYPFNVVYAMGLRPGLRYVPCSWSGRMERDEAIEDIADDYSRYKDIDDEIRRGIARFVDSRLDEDGMYPAGTSATLGVMTWKTRQEI